MKKNNVKVELASMEDKQKLSFVDKYEGIIVLGGPMGAYESEKYPFLIEEEFYLKQALQKKIPVLGVCLGAQLLAKAAGAKIKKAPSEERGWYDLWLEEEAEKDPLLGGLDKELKVFQWHQDTFEVPEKGVLLAKGKNCKNQAFRVGDYAWGLQFHPEMNKGQIINWLKHYNSKAKKEQIIYDYFYNQDKYLTQAKKICSNFLAII